MRMKTLSGPTQRGLDPSRRSEVSIQHVCFKVCSQSGRKSVGVRAGRLAPPSRFRSASLWRGVCVSRGWRRRLNTKAVCCLCLAVCRLLVSSTGSAAEEPGSLRGGLLQSSPLLHVSMAVTRPSSTMTGTSSSTPYSSHGSGYTPTAAAEEHMNVVLQGNLKAFSMDTRRKTAF